MSNERKDLHHQNVWMVCPRFFPFIGGVEKHTLMVSLELIKKGYTVNIVTPQFDKKHSNVENYKGIRVLRIPVKYPWYCAGVKKFLINYHLKQIKRNINSDDIIHYHDFYYYHKWAEVLTPDKENVYLTFHGYEGKHPPDPDIISIRQKIATKVRGHISIGDFIDKWYGTKADIICYGGTDITEPPAQIPDSYCACFIGRLEPDTGIEKYIRAIKLLKDVGIRFNLDVCGEGSLRHNLMEYCEQNELSVKWHRNVSAPATFLSKGLFAFASGYLAILDAMASKRLVIAVYDNPFKRDYLYLMPLAAEHMFIANSEEEVAKYIKMVIENPDVVEPMIVKAHRWAQGRSWEAVSSEYIRLWTEK